MEGVYLACNRSTFHHHQAPVPLVSVLCCVLCAAQARLRRLTYLIQVGANERTSLVSAINMTQAAFLAQHPGYKAWAKKHGEV